MTVSNIIMLQFSFSLDNSYHIMDERYVLTDQKRAL